MLATTLGTATHADVAGTNRVRFSGRVKGRRLSAGTYRMVLVAVSASGQRSAPKTLNFTIVR